MAKFDLKKAILENKATFFSSLTEGQFSWFTQDTEQQIGSERENTLPFVYMHDDKGNKWLEKNYDGYGEFGGKDYYDLVAEMNGYTLDDAEELGGTFNDLRGIGIKLAFGELEPKNGGPVLFPALTVSATLPNGHDFTKEAETDPNQSWYAEEEEEEDDYYSNRYGDEDEDEEELDEAELPVLTADQVEMIAQQVADKFSATDDLDIKFSITPGSVEADPKGAGFDLDTIAGPNTPGDDWKDENGFDIDNYLGKYAGGSYYIKPEGGKHKIYNAAAQNAYIGHVTPQGEVVFEIPGFEGTMDQLNSLEEEKTKTKMKKSELKELIKSSIMNEVYLDIDNMEDAPESEVDFLAEVDAILAEANEFDTNKPARIAEFIKALDMLVDEYHAELYLSDDLFSAVEMVKKAANEAINLNEAEDEVAVDDTEVAVGGEENIDVDTTVEVDPNVKAVQDSLTQAQAAAQKLGDPKLTDQIGNTITFFTRAHVVDKGAVAEADEMEEGKKSYYKDAEADDAEHIKALEKDMKDDKKSSMKIKEASISIEPGDSDSDIGYKAFFAYENKISGFGIEDVKKAGKIIANKVKNDNKIQNTNEFFMGFMDAWNESGYDETADKEDLYESMFPMLKKILK